MDPSRWARPAALLIGILAAPALGQPTFDPKNFPACPGGKSEKCSIGDAGWTFTPPSGLKKEQPQPGVTAWIWRKDTPGKSIKGLDVPKQMAVLQVSTDSCGDDVLADFCKKTDQSASGEMIKETHKGKQAYRLSCEKGVRVSEYIFIRLTPKKCIIVNIGFNTEESQGVADAGFTEVLESLGPPGAVPEVKPPAPAVAATSTAPVSESAPPPEVPEGPPQPRRVSTVKIPREAASWPSLAVRKGGDAAAAANSATLQIRLKKVKAPPPAEAADPPAEGQEAPAPPEFVYREQGNSSRAKAVARSYKTGEDRLLVISIYPERLRGVRTHLEIHFKVVEGFLDGAEVKAIQRPGAFLPKDLDQDSVILRGLAMEFIEEGPSGGRLTAAAMEAKPGKDSFNAGALRGASFAGKSLGTVNLTYSIQGVAAGRK